VWLSLLTVTLVISAAPAEEASPSVPTARFPKGTARMELGPLPAELESWDAAACVSCHPAQAEAWARSGHATARTDFVFQAALAEDRPEWCVGCHAPLAWNLTREPLPPGAPAEERGVTCAACHAVERAVAGTMASANAPHAVKPGPALKDPLLCAGCHQFGFAIRDPDSERLLRLSRPPQQQQDTWQEWNRWRADLSDKRTCRDCHMPQGDHSFGGVRRVEALRAALHVAVVPGGEALEVWTEGVGHLLPTGDVMRWLSVEVAPDFLFEEPRILMRLGRSLSLSTWAPEPLPHLGVRADTSLAPGARLRVPLPRATPGRPWKAWRLVYHLVSKAQEHEGLIPSTTSRITLHAGPLPLTEPSR
jgi:nitrate/TMAO reductase-like tetraheme cytochrome c subunit